MPHAKAIKYTLDGEAIVYTDGKVVYPPVPDSVEMPVKFKTQHEEAMHMIASFIVSVKQVAPKREMPALRAELIDFGVSKRMISELNDMELIQVRLVSILDTNNANKPVGSRAIVYFTPLGKAYFRRGMVADA